MPGLTLTGFETQTIADVRDLINTRWREAFGASMDVSDRSPDGQEIGIVSERFALVWEVLEAIVASQDPRAAVGAALDALCALTGTVREPATFSAVTLTLTGTPTVVVPTDSLVSTESTEQQFTTLEDGEIEVADAWTDTTPYVVGDRVTNAGNVYLCITAGTSAGSGGPDTDEDDITDNTVHWRFLGEGTGYVDVTARATVTGPVVAVSGDIMVRDSVVGGWDGVINILDATVGRDQMTDAELRALRELELGRPGTSPKDAIRAALLDVAGVTSVTVFMNVSDVTDDDGVPPHAIEALVQGGDDQDIWDALLANVAAGIRTHGTEEGTAVDSEGQSQDMAFSRPEEIDIYVDVTLTYDANLYPEDGDDQVKAAIAAFGNTLENGRDVVSSALLSRVFSVAGVLDVELPLIDDAPGPSTSTTIPISLRQKAVYDTSRIDVTSSPAVP